MNQYNCKICGKEFFDKRNRLRLFCSKKCMNKHYTVNFNCVQCGKESTYKRSQLKKYPKRGTFCSMVCLRMYYKTRPKETRYLSEHGYFLNQGKTYEHRRVMMEHLGRDLSEGEQIHHINLDKTDNKIDNLYVCSNQTIHNKLHWTLNRLVKTLMIDNIVCFKNGEYYLEKDYEKRFKK